MKLHLFIVLAALFPSIALGQPSIEFATEIHDFGLVMRGEQLEYSFKFTNRGKDELVITDLEAS